MTVTEQDRERARHIAADWSLHFGTDDLDPLESMIATFLADERERARAPFLALAEEIDDDSPYEGDNGGWKDGSRATERHIADRIRRAVEESQ